MDYWLVRTVKWFNDLFPPIENPMELHSNTSFAIRQRELFLWADVIKKEVKSERNQAQTAWSWTEKALRCGIGGGWNKALTSKVKTSRVQFVTRQNKQIKHIITSFKKVITAPIHTAFKEDPGRSFIHPWLPKTRTSNILSVSNCWENFSLNSN